VISAAGDCGKHPLVLVEGAEDGTIEAMNIADVIELAIQQLAKTKGIGPKAWATGHVTIAHTGGYATPMPC
jgi:hypothetical protein